MLIWQSQYDDNSNTEWLAQSCVVDEFGDAYYWRLSQKLESNRIQWVENHDSDIFYGEPCSFETLEEAKDYIEEFDKSVLAES